MPRSRPGGLRSIKIPPSQEPGGGGGCQDTAHLAGVPGLWADDAQARRRPKGAAHGRHTRGAPRRPPRGRGPPRLGRRRRRRPARQGRLWI